MIRNKTLLKTFSVFSVFLMLENLFLPALSYALTSGPNAPEATSFEPVDTSSMVDALTGDMTYGLPLLEVPGPSGGYPLSLAYHAGIMPNEEASWVGLGWVLNPGSISRSVSGYPDDHDGVSDVNREVWEGGETTTTTFGLSGSLFGYASVDVGLTISRDTYRGFSVREHANLRGGTGPFQVDGDGNVVGIRSSIGGHMGQVANLSAGLSFNHSSGLTVAGSLTAGGSGISASTSGGLGGSGSFSPLGISMTSAQNSFSIAGFSVTKTANNNKSGKISTRTKSSGLRFAGLSMQKTYQRYWIDETSEVSTFGSLHFPESVAGGIPTADRSYDVYDLPDNEDFNDANAVNQTGGTFVDYDHYNVSAQGVGGTMRPFHYYKHLTRQTELNENDEVTVQGYRLNIQGNKAQFKFENEFSNRLGFSDRVAEATTPFSNLDDGGGLQPSGSSSENQMSSSNNYFEIEAADLIHGISGSDGMVNGQLITKSPIRYYTNEQIRTGADVAGFVECTAPGFDRGTLGAECDDQIGAFTVTNESGVNYHYSLPAYSYDEYSYSGREDDRGKDYVNQQKRLTKYAYTWFLTGVTGPDYVDRNGNGKTDKGDYGYWVNFEYGKWTDSYGWRNPAQGVNRDLDQAFGTFSKGKKELYYLNAISTESHTALFIKEIRKDGKSTTSSFDDAVIIEDKQEKYRDEGGHGTARRFFPDVDESTGFAAGNYYLSHAKSTLKLNKILLVKNSKVNLDISSSGNLYDDVFTYDYVDKNGKARTFIDRYHYGENIIDIDDFAQNETQLLNATAKGIDFNTSYVLTPNTPNSFEAFTANDDDDGRRGNPRYELFGKLTLESLDFLGDKGQGKGLIPPLTFDYDLDEPAQDMTFDLVNEKITTSAPLEMGSLYKLSAYDHYFVVTTEDTGTGYSYLFLDPGARSSDRGSFPDDVPGSEGSTITVSTKATKNPPYLSEFYDIWGFFKSDYFPDEVRQGSSFGRRVTDLSAKSVDVWSLRKINNGIGSTIALTYETDEYDRSVLGGKMMVPLEDVIKIDDGEIEIHLPDDVTFSDVQNYLENIYVGIVGVYENPTSAESEPPVCEGDEFDGGFFRENCLIGNSTYLSNYWEAMISKGKYNYDPSNHTISIETPLTRLEEMTAPTMSVNYDGNRLCCRNMDASPIYNTPCRWPDHIAAAAIEVFSKYGGGLRVRDITVSDGLNERRTSYTYDQGITSYEPLGMLRPELRQEFLDEIGDGDASVVHIGEVVKDYNKMISSKFNELMGMVRELPGPNVLYSTVEIKESVNEAGSEYIDLPESKVLAFQTYGEGGVYVNRVIEPNSTDPQLENFDYDEIKLSRVVIRDESSKVGLLTSMSVVDEGAEPISRTSYTYHSGAAVNDQGVIHEVFLDARRVKQQEPTDEDYHLVGAVSRRETIPTQQASMTTFDRKTGITTTQWHLGYDFYSGQLLQKKTQDSRGNYFLDEGIPAYQHYPEMGPILLGGKNMLTQSAGDQKWKVDADHTKLGLVSANVQIWSDQTPVLELGAQPGIWRKERVRTWNGQATLNVDGTYPITAFNEFNYNSTTNPGWLTSSRITLYDVNSHALEASDVNGDFAATRMDKDNLRVIATTALSRYAAMTYSGAEQQVSATQLEGNVQQGDGQIANVRSHTGQYSLVIPSGGEGFRYTIPVSALTGSGNGFMASVWVYLPGNAESPGQIGGAELYYEINGARTSVSPEYQKNKAKSWYRLELVIAPNGANDIIIGCSNTTSRGVYFDDFRVHPIQAAMTSYVYDDLTDRLTYILDGDNLYTHFEYDAHGRLIRTTKEHMNFSDGSFRADQTVSETIYNYGNE